RSRDQELALADLQADPVPPHVLGLIPGPDIRGLDVLAARLLGSIIAAECADCEDNRQGADVNRDPAIACSAFLCNGTWHRSPSATNGRDLSSRLRTAVKNELRSRPKMIVGVMRDGDTVVPVGSTSHLMRNDPSAP